MKKELSNVFNMMSVQDINNLIYDIQLARHTLESSPKELTEKECSDIAKWLGMYIDKLLNAKVNL